MNQIKQANTEQRNIMCDCFQNMAASSPWFEWIALDVLKRQTNPSGPWEWVVKGIRAKKNGIKKNTIKAFLIFFPLKIVNFVLPDKVSNLIILKSIKTSPYSKEEKYKIRIL